VVGTGGVQAAQAQRIAFLEDDGEWILGKLDIQLRTAQRSSFPNTVGSCCFIKRSETTDVVLFRRLPLPGAYLFRRTHLFEGEGLVQSSWAGQPSGPVRYTTSGAGVAEGYVMALTRHRCSRSMCKRIERTARFSAAKQKLEEDRSYLALLLDGLKSLDHPVPYEPVEPQIGCTLYLVELHSNPPLIDPPDFRFVDRK